METISATFDHTQITCIATAEMLDTECKVSLEFTSEKILEKRIIFATFTDKLEQAPSTAMVLLGLEFCCLHSRFDKELIEIVWQNKEHWLDETFQNKIKKVTE